MSEINFTESNGKFVCETEVSADFNLHIEFKESGSSAPFVAEVETKTSGTKYAHVTALKGMVVDEDFDGIIYPKTIRITTAREVDKAYVTEKE